MKLKKLLILSIIGFISFSSCKKDDPVTPVIPNEEELITTLNYTLTNAFDSTDVVRLTFVDLDGDGGNEPTITGGSLNANKTYNGTMELLDETDPADVEDITEEVLEEDEDHQFFFSAASITVNYSDVDTNNNPVGLQTSLDAGDAGLDTLKITLIHEPTKPNNGTVADAGGEVDIEVSFPINVVQ